MNSGARSLVPVILGMRCRGDSQPRLPGRPPSSPSVGTCSPLPGALPGAPRPLSGPVVGERSAVTSASSAHCGRQEVWTWCRNLPTGSARRPKRGRRSVLLQWREEPASPCVCMTGTARWPEF